MGADNHVDLPGSKPGLRLPLFLRGHGAGELFHTKTEGFQKAPQRRQMLLGQNLRRRHERGLPPRAADGPDAGRGHQRFAAAHVALDKAVHRRLPGHVPQRIRDGAPLRAGGGEGQRGVELRGFDGRDRRSAALLPAAAQAPHRALQYEQFLEDQPPPGQLQRAEIHGEMDILIGVARLRQGVFRPHGLRQGVRDIVAGFFQRGADIVHQHLVADPGGEGIAGKNAPGLLPLPFLRLKVRIGHRALFQRAAELAVEDVALPGADLVADIDLIEKRDIDAAAVVHGAEFHEEHPAAHVRQPRLRGHQSADADRFLQRRGHDGRKAGAVLVGARKMLQQVPDLQDAQLVQRFRPRFADALQVADVLIQSGHVIHLG